MLKANYHTHTTYCDGRSTPEEMVLRAIELGFEHLGFSGHVDIDPVMDVPAYLAEITRLQEKYRGRIDILRGGELDNMYPDRRPAGFEYLIGSAHHMRSGDQVLAVDWSEEQLLRLLNEGFGGDGLKLCRAYFRLIAETYHRGSCTWIGHFDLVTRHNHSLHFVDEEDPAYLASAREVIEYLVGEDLPLEINTKQAHWGKLYPGAPMLKALRELGGEIVISSDAHHISELDKGFDRAAALAKSCGFDHANILVRGPRGLEFAQVAL